MLLSEGNHYKIFLDFFDIRPYFNPRSLNFSMKDTRSTK